MRCTSKRISCCVLVLAVLLTGCKGVSYSAKYSIDESVSGKRDENVYPTFASDLCVADEDKKPEDSKLEISDKASAGLFDLTRKETIYAKNINLRVMPASLTKVMTAYVALKYGSLDDVLTANSDVYVNESGAQKVNVKEGDKMTLDQALHLLLIYSANDIANLIASNITGPSGEDFVTLMNQEAKNIGATNSHFENPHGLTSDEHYVTAYDMYLIFNAAMQYDTFSEIINMTEYTTTYQDGKGGTKDISVKNTNGFLSGAKSAPKGVTVIGGKTGTTNAAGHCLILLARDVNGDPYISVIMRDEDAGVLYTDMARLLEEIVG
ncbi:D-alanyl-D-alanine carboxypeptidase family protein [Butyrivibrio sp. INlla21]|uniref:D-alanyl-D-alanine carboxypeptidase family protein n=1 Tax=Butyrivibrio sp. INlla21 TaxID=1520811 RepID=UPI0008E8003E|nr:D-alanyl-D-alanine carboxypeptidase [Butyrivibrio sp. INlla21]SFU80795.1 D-alanyl-D-alanine carboxypeptidase [Butyrivibrio sp. INlla21]